MSKLFTIAAADKWSFTQFKRLALALLIGTCVATVRRKVRDPGYHDLEENYLWLTFIKPE